MRYQYLDSGSFGRKKIFYKFIGKKFSSKIRFFFLHGVFSTTLKDKYFNLAKEIERNKMGSIFLYETSRKIYSWESNLKFEKYEQTFKGKTFEDEKKDVKKVFDYFLKITSIKEKNIVLIGFSLGGTLASFLLPEYGQLIRSIFLFGSGISTKRKELPILSSYPLKEKVIDNFKNFNGSIYLVQGDEDNVVPKEEARKILKVKNNSLIKKMVILKNVDHRFYLVSEGKKLFIKEWIFQFIKNSLLEEDKIKQVV